MYPRATTPALARDPRESAVRRDGPESTSHAPSAQPHFMLVPSLACPAACSYCFGPHEGPTMSPQTMESALDFIARIAGQTQQGKVKVTFHGGEPLVAGHTLWRQALEGLRQRFGPKGYEVGLQSNLWLLDDELCELFSEHRVDVGTSLDGPEAITDAQRGTGYFGRTMRGVRKAEAYGIRVGCIATFTPASARQWGEVFDFFLSERLGFSIHAAVPPADGRDGRYAIAPERYGELLCEMLEYYVEQRREISVSSLDQMCQGLGCGEGKVCTFRDCLGMFLAIDPGGDVYPCQRFCGLPSHRLGNLGDRPGLDELLDSPVARRMRDRQDRVREACDGCPHLDYCRGGCPYNAWANGDGARVRDPYCPAYRTTFDHIQARLLEEMASERNIEAIAARPYDGRGHPLLREGPLIELVRKGRHPSHIARTAKRIVAAVELARGPDVNAVAARLVKMGVCRSPQSALVSLAGLKRRLEPRPGVLNNLYVHVTFGCQLNCTHCYARADAQGREQGEMPIEAVVRLVGQANETRFRQVVISGGEPLVHSQRDRLLAALHEARSWAAPMNLVLRTNLAMRLSGEDLRRIALAVDQVVVSIDGSPETHDARRGEGSYAAVVRNLEAYVELARDMPSAGEISLATVMRSADIQGEPGDAVRGLAARLGIRRVRFRPLLPLGRAADWDEPPTSEALGAHADPMELIESGFEPVASCGLGQNLYVEPSGDSFPCYAYHQPHSYLGNATQFGLNSVLESAGFRDLSGHDVDTNLKCRTCEMRYLCGGACRAWGRKSTQHNLDATPPDCGGLNRRARALLGRAFQALGIDESSEVRPC
ncbi:MAG TPA: TIGR04083 family peptide-modifying radical SAM enzyme [Thermoguttaceae bacterium]|nr:TIGR04083 family peptide-modifying radical SAM enzyme [Thermoguttaceae bacterium]